MGAIDNCSKIRKARVDKNRRAVHFQVVCCGSWQSRIIGGGCGLGSGMKFRIFPSLFIFLSLYTHPSNTMHTIKIQTPPTCLRVASISARISSLNGNVLGIPGSFLCSTKPHRSAWTPIPHGHQTHLISTVDSSWPLFSSSFLSPQPCVGS
jgi:hypothetical protein